MTSKTIVKRRQRNGAHQAVRLKQILAPMDFSPASYNAYQYALRFAEEFNAQLTVLFVLEPERSASLVAIPGASASAFSNDEFAEAEKNLRSLTVSARLGNVKRPHLKLRVGVPSHEIVEAAKEADADLIIVATHGYTGWKHFCIGSTAERVVRAAPCPVLVVREKEHEFR